MKIALFQGKSLISKIVRFTTRSCYSHAAFLFDEMSHKAAVEVVKSGVALPKLKFIESGSLVEAWDSGVRNVESISDQHTPGTPVDIFSLVDPLTLAEEMALIQLLHGDIGDAYGWTNVFRFITRKPGKEDGSWFCSEQVFRRLCDIGHVLLARTQAWEVPPNWIARSTLLRRVEGQVTVWEFTTDEFSFR